MALHSADGPTAANSMPRGRIPTKEDARVAVDRAFLKRNHRTRLLSRRASFLVCRRPVCRRTTARAGDKSPSQHAAMPRNTRTSSLPPSPTLPAFAKRETGKTCRRPQHPSAHNHLTCHAAPVSNPDISWPATVIATVPGPHSRAPTYPSHQTFVARMRTASGGCLVRFKAQLMGLDSGTDTECKSGQTQRGTAPPPANTPYTQCLQIHRAKCC